MSIWEQFAATYLALPFDRVLDPDEARAEERAERYLAAAGIECPAEQRQRIRETFDSILRDYPLGKVPPIPVRGRYEVVHPLSGGSRPIDAPEPDPDRVAALLEELVRPHDNETKRALCLWRLLPDRLRGLSPAYAWLPADGRLPGVPLWPALDFCAGLVAAEALARIQRELDAEIEEEEEEEKADEPEFGDALRVTVISIPKVQRYVARSRTTRDLWSASMFVAWTMLRCIQVIGETMSPAVIVSPSLRGNPWVDHWLRHGYDLTEIPQPPDRQLRISALPNTLVVLSHQKSWLRVQELTPLPWFREELLNFARRMEMHLQEHIPQELLNEATRSWPLNLVPIPERTVSAAFTGDYALCRTPEHCWGTEPEEVPGARLRDLLRQPTGNGRQCPRSLDDLPPGWWMDTVHVAFRQLLAGDVVVSLSPCDSVAAPACTQCGEFEQMGPVDYDRSREFWRLLQAAPPLEGIRLNRRDRLCAFDMIKRFGYVMLKDAFGLDDGARRMPDVATIAAACWLEKARQLGYRLDPTEIWERHGYWSGEWLHWPRPDFDPDEPACPAEVFQEIVRARGDRQLGPPPTYYAVLLADGDSIGAWLQAERGPALRRLLHPTVTEQLLEAGVDPTILESPALLTAPFQKALSQAMTAYAMQGVLPTVESHAGLLVYAGGDDTLAFLPTATAVACATALRQRFATDVYEANQSEWLGPGSTMTLSAGIAIVHHKESLRAALAAARDAEGYAKGSGRDLLGLAVCRRSGEWTRVACPWDFVDAFARWLEAFSSGASDRWTYQLAREVDSLAAAGLAAFRSELKRLLMRSAPATVAAFNGAENVQQDFDRFVSARRARHPDASDQLVCREFVMLLQTASFLCRATAGASG